METEKTIITTISIDEIIKKLWKVIQSQNVNLIIF
jgi:2-hydroxy-3-keto-5-methylthiopentenyl-1-phosphate phosphatase